jgi:hypothetical protein
VHPHRLAQTFYCGVCARFDFDAASALAAHAAAEHPGDPPGAKDVLVCAPCALAFHNADAHAGHWAHVHAQVGEIDMGRRVAPGLLVDPAPDTTAAAAGGGGIVMGDDAAAWIDRLSRGAAAAERRALVAIDTDAWPRYATDLAARGGIPADCAVAVFHRADPAAAAAARAAVGPHGFAVAAPAGRACDSSLLLRVPAWADALAGSGVEIVVVSSDEIVRGLAARSGVRVVEPSDERW